MVEVFRDGDWVMNELAMLRAIAEMVLLWAKSPEYYRGNPYTKEFVRLSCQWEREFLLIKTKECKEC